MTDQMKLFDVDATRRVLVGDEVYCAGCRVVGRQLEDYPECPMCGGGVEVAGAVIDDLPGGLPQPWGTPVH